MSTVRQAIRDGAITSVFQPIVDLDSGHVVAYEALARGPRGTDLERPDQLFAAARSEELLAELDEACRIAAFTGAIGTGLLAPLTLFVNVEPEVLDSAPMDDLLALAERVPGQLRVVVEITERALAHRPAELLRTVDRVRELGWGIALDDVGADSLSLAFMPLLRPDVVKLDLRLVQERPGPAVAQIMNAVNAYAQSTGATVLAEGIEDERHLTIARALGARLGQGWMFGRPQAGPADGYEVGELSLPPALPLRDANQSSPFTLLTPHDELRRSPKSLLIALSKQLEREAMRLGDTCVVAATFQEAVHFTPATAARYRDLVERTGFVCALGEGLSDQPVPGLRGATLDSSDPIRGEWDVVVLAPHFSVALLARDLGDNGPDPDRTFEYALTYERDTVVAAARSLLSRVAPRTDLPTGPAPASVAAPEAGSGPVRVAAAVPRTTPAGEALLHRALAATTSGVTIADMRRPDQPLIYVNQAFEHLSGCRAEEVLGRNCRFLQGTDTDPGVVNAVRTAISEGREWRGTLLNHRGEARTPWWNEIYLAPVVGADGRVLQYIGVQNDVTARVDAQRALEHERDRAQSYLARIEALAYTDPLTGLANRRRVEERIDAALWDARADGHALALLFVDLDRFKAVNDALGHAAGDELLVVIARRLREQVRRTDLLARLGGDEFLIALPGLDPATALTHAHRVAEHLTREISRPVSLGGELVVVGTSIGTSVYPADGTEFSSLLHHADQRMYATKHAHRGAGATADSPL